jgi:uncharacterized protein involved in tolerance to divalent cations
MILLRISAPDEQVIEKAAQLLLTESLAIDLNLKRQAQRIVLEKGKLKSEPLFILTGKTKALLFSVIEKKFHDLFGNTMPELYSLPIVNMEWKQAEVLAEKIRKI